MITRERLADLRAMARYEGFCSSCKHAATDSDDLHVWTECRIDQPREIVEQSSCGIACCEAWEWDGNDERSVYLEGTTTELLELIDMAGRCMWAEEACIDYFNGGSGMDCYRIGRDAVTKPLYLCATTEETQHD